MSGRDVGGEGGAQGSRSNLVFRASSTGVQCDK
jgi:hypothetical protein